MWCWDFIAFFCFLLCRQRFSRRTTHIETVFAFRTDFTLIRPLVVARYTCTWYSVLTYVAEKWILFFLFKISEVAATLSLSSMAVRWQAPMPENDTRKNEICVRYWYMVMAATAVSAIVPIILIVIRCERSTAARRTSLRIQQHLVNWATCPYRRVLVFCFVSFLPFFDYVRVKTSQPGQRIHCICSFLL